MDNKCDKHSAHEEKLIRIDKDIEDLHGLRDRVTIAEQSTKSAHNRLDNFADPTKAIINLGNSIENMAKDVKNMLKTTNKNEERIDDLEKAPAERIYSYWKIIVGVLISSGVGIVIGALIK